MDDGTRIRTVFLERRTTYAETVAASLAGLGRDELRQRIESGEVDATMYVTHSVAWEDLARLIMERTPVDAIFEALGDRADEVLPPLLKHERLDIRVPAYVLRACEWAAKAKEMSLEEYLRRELVDLVESLWGMNPAIDELPGVAEALFFPDAPPPRHRKRP